MGLIIFIVSIITMVASLLFFPIINLKKIKLETYWVVIVIGAFILILTKSVDLSSIYSSLTKNGGINPLKLIILFISMTILSIYLDEIGFFKWLALNLIKSQVKLFYSIYLMVSVLTVFTSNDVIILTFTPLIIYFTKAAKINPLPYLFGILTSANTWSIVLIIGNPTNIYLAVNQGISFLDYLKVMLLPGLVAGISGFIMVYLTFKKSLKKQMLSIDERVVLQNKFQVIVGVIFVLLTIILIAISNFIHIEMWLITLLMVILLTIIITVYTLIKRLSFTPLIRTYKKAPWSFVPFIISMFVLLESIKQGSYILFIVNLLEKTNVVYTYGFASFIGSNLMNNQPMSMLFSIILENTNPLLVQKATYASIIGSNLGVLLTPLGALAGLMWMRLLKKHDISLSFFSYIKNIFLIGIVTLLLTLTTLYLII